MGQELGEAGERGEGRSGVRGWFGEGQKKEERGQGGKCVPTVLPEEKCEKEEKEGKGKKHASGEGATEERQGGQGGQKREKEGAEEGAGIAGTEEVEGKEFLDVPRVEPEHERGAGNVPGDGSEQNEGREESGGGEGEEGMEEKGRRKTLVALPPTHEEKQTFSDAKEGEGIERMVGFKAHGKVPGGVFEEIEEEGGQGTGERPEAPDNGVARELGGRRAGRNAMGGGRLG